MISTYVNGNGGMEISEQLVPHPVVARANGSQHHIAVNSVISLGIAWRAVRNRHWRIPFYNGKFRQLTERNGGGFGVQTGRQAIALGMRPVLFTTIGDDAAGVALRDEFEDIGADLSGVRFSPGMTSKAEVITCNGNRTVLFDQNEPGVDWTPHPDDWRLARNLDAFCIGGTLPRNVFDEVRQQASELGKPVFANPTRLDNAATCNLEGVRILQVSRDDVTNFGFAPDAAAASVAEFFLGLGCDNVVVTESQFGERGFDQGSNCVWMPAVPDRKPSYPTGCGDTAFLGHVAGYLAGLCMYDWLNIGTLAGGFFVEHGYPGSLADLLQLGKEFPPKQRLNG